jgi:hypothetical protein
MPRARLRYPNARVSPPLPRPALPHPTPSHSQGSVADGYAPVAARCARLLADGDEIGTAFCVCHR